MIRVVLVEDQTLVRHGIRSLIATTGDIEVAAEAADGKEALERIPLHKPDCVLLDIRLPEFSGIEVLRRLARVMPLPPTILLTTFDDDEALLQGIRAGAKGYLLKDVSIDQLADSMRRVVAGETRIRPAITERATRVLKGAASSFDSFDLSDPLTKREAEILRMMAGGFSNREIGEALGCSEGTIKNHASSILSKLGVRDRTRAVLRGIELGMI